MGIGVPTVPVPESKTNASTELGESPVLRYKADFAEGGGGGPPLELPPPQATAKMLRIEISSHAARRAKCWGRNEGSKADRAACE